MHTEPKMDSTLFLIIFRIDRDFCEMDGSYSDESNQLNYFYPDESEQHKKYV